MAYTSMVSTVVANDNSQAISPFKAKEHSKGSFRQRTFINNKQSNELISLYNFRKSYLCQQSQKQLQNLSHKLVEHHLRQIMIRIKKWTGYCSRTQLDSFCCDKNVVLDFLG